MLLTDLIEKGWENLRKPKTAPTRWTVPSEVAAQYWRDVVLVDPPVRRKPQPAPRITEWTLIRAWIDGKIVARRIRRERAHEKLMAQAEQARQYVQNPDRYVVLPPPWRQ